MKKSRMDAEVDCEPGDQERDPTPAPAPARELDPDATPVDAWVIGRGKTYLFARRGDGSGRWTTAEKDALVFLVHELALEVARAVAGNVRKRKS
jgi:hypothetical protein